MEWKARRSGRWSFPLALVGAAVLAAGGMHRALAAPAGNVSALHALVQDYDRFSSALDPLSAAARGDEAAAERWPDDSLAAEQARYRTLLDFRRRLDAIDTKALSGEDAINDALIAWTVDLAIEGRRFDEGRMPFTSDEGFYLVPGYAAENSPLHDEAAARRWLTRMRALPAFYDQQIANMKRGIATGFVQPRLIALKVVEATRALAALPPERSALMAPFDTLPNTIPKARRDALRAEGLAIVRDRIKPAEEAVARFMKDAYLPASRATLGAFDLPDGRAYYAYRVRSETTTGMTPDEVFALGQSEIARLHAAMQAQMDALGFKGDFKAFVAALRGDQRFYVKTREALMEKASRLAKEVDDRLPGVIGKLPRLPYGVRQVPEAIEEGYTSGRYNPGSPALGIAGGLMINTSHLDQRPLYELPSLVAHEGAPGHHIQIALGQEMADLPGFRRDYATTAFVEGWALYSEQLVTEFGFYPTPYERFGQLSMEMWRACRLVMDVGLHWKGWTRDQAVACLRDNTAVAEKNIQNEVDRYIAWPGQALGYKIGELTIASLRHQAEAALGNRFDERRFHDVVLDEGAMPMDLLKARVAAWIEAEKKKTS
ncbi:DUF885 domain-containing protein [Gluconacetobacter asukensis]|uniref:DUF885 family protein n=1 Tax=Gluconacetobacter asukensis TaxID=1017181 RepID=A0A7W4J2S9_9PROT|nr:DUF885 family protein [Gluconacetobacter asukensis]MBB2173616.1 DUF885 family protein [Gluconacetobacter asukensis]